MRENPKTSETRRAFRFFDVVFNLRARLVDQTRAALRALDLLSREAPPHVCLIHALGPFHFIPARRDGLARARVCLLKYFI